MGTHIEKYSLFCGICQDKKYTKTGLHFSRRTAFPSKKSLHRQMLRIAAHLLRRFPVSGGKAPVERPHAAKAALHGNFGDRLSLMQQV